MATSLDNRVELENAFYRLTGLSGSDGRWTAHETASEDTLFTWMFQAMRNAQAWYLDHIDYARWHKTSSTLSWSGTEAANGGRYSDLPSDFVRLFDQRRIVFTLDLADAGCGATLDLILQARPRPGGKNTVGTIA